MESKIPWRTHHCYVWVVLDADGKEVCDVSPEESAGVAEDDKRDTVNAAIIVHCVNAHDGLVEALDRIASSSYPDANREIAKAALKAAGEEL